MGHESTAETGTPCQLNFVDRKHFLELTESQSDVGMHTVRCQSRDFQSAYRDIHHLVLTRFSTGKLARLLMSHSLTQGVEAAETRIHSSMTHEEMAQRIGSSRETVTFRRFEKKVVDSTGRTDVGYSGQHRVGGSGNLGFPDRNRTVCFGSRGVVRTLLPTF
jgi:CRP-like cAMP-binding protein